MQCKQIDLSGENAGPFQSRSTDSSGNVEI